MADVHSNLRALTAVIDDALRLGGFDSIWMLGDVVGYGPEPNECIALLQTQSLVCVAGNHDLGVAGRIDLSQFNPVAAEACLWTRGRLSASSSQFLGELTERCARESFVLVHASPREPIWEYVTSAVQARQLAAYCEKTHCLVGHTHSPLALSMLETEVPFRDGLLQAGKVLLRGRLIINPGGVGQPRDGDPRAAYGILDMSAGTFSFHRVKYDVTGTVRAIHRSGLPSSLARRWYGAAVLRQNL